MQKNERCDTYDQICDRHEQEHSAFKALNPIEQARHQVKDRIRYAADPWAFLCDCVFTLDQVSNNDVIKLFPSYLEYVEFLAQLWMREKLIAAPKSRRMICSWTFISLYTHNTIMNQGRMNGFVSKKDEDSAELVARAEFIYKHIPEWRIPKAMLPELKNGKISKKPAVMEFENIYSKIVGYPQGADQLRQFTHSGLLFDEWAFWDKAQSSYSSAKPTIDGGGRLTGISSRSPGFFKKIVFDQLDSYDLTFPEKPPMKPLRPMEGIEIWRNPKNKFVVIDLHYTADPKKRGELWRESVRSSMPARDFEMEYEKSWQTFEGKPIYTDYKRKTHISHETLKPEPAIPLLIGWAFGLSPTAILVQLEGRRLKVLKEFIESDGSISKLSTSVWNWLIANMPQWFQYQDDMIINWAAPEGFERTETDERTCIEVLRTCGDLKHPEKRIGFRNIRPGPLTLESRHKAVENYLTAIYGEGPGLLISEPDCPTLIEGFSGGYRYPEKSGTVEPINIAPLKNKYCYPHNALQFVAAGSSQIRKSYRFEKEIPIPFYGFQTQSTDIEKKDLNPFKKDSQKSGGL